MRKTELTVVRALEGGGGDPEDPDDAEAYQALQGLQRAGRYRPREGKGVRSVQRVRDSAERYGFRGRPVNCFTQIMKRHAPCPIQT